MYLTVCILITGWSLCDEREIQMSEKLCVFCKHFQWYEFEYTYYSTLTGGDLSGGLSCGEGHFLDRNPVNTVGFRSLIRKAEFCKDYSPPTEKELS